MGRIQEEGGSGHERERGRVGMKERERQRGRAGMKEIERVTEIETERGTERKRSRGTLTPSFPLTVTPPPFTDSTRQTRGTQTTREWVIFNIMFIHTGGGWMRERTTRE